MPAILDSIFYKVVNTTSIPIGVEGEGWWVATKWRGVPIQNFLWPNGFNSGCFQLHTLWPNGFNSGCFQLHTSQNVATSIPSLTSQSCSDSLPSVCLAGQVEAIYRPPEHPWTPDRPGP